ncbi:cyclase family protein [Actinoallomurus rhizosphaericola]|uniref:cyclase family protein n=1 Tax=Actinoallomurus rhizosphaericola TaxID=2952536 RepID=UPI002092A10C|nr:cyclase family protein [Actinoallomurus rhizosphaericola]MCO5997373.1 cyclase family protein [Actinoallomurus rhizosphaericola]
MSHAEFDRLFDSVRAWRRWPDAARGAWNQVKAGHTLAAAALVRSGTVVPMARPWSTTPGPDNPRPALHHMTELGDVEEPEPTIHRDFIAVDYHGKAVSHLDALGHVAYRGRVFGGYDARRAVDSAGVHHGSVDRLGALMTRGVLLDLPLVRGVPWIEPGQAVRAADVIAAEAALGVRIAEGDAVLVRSGQLRRRQALGPWDPSAACAGLHVDVVPLLAERGIALLGGDGDNDVRPSPVPGVHSPIHALAVAAMGVPLLDNLDLEGISTACGAAGRYEFLFVVAPLDIPGGTGSPVTPVGVL